MTEIRDMSQTFGMDERRVLLSTIAQVDAELARVDVAMFERELTDDESDELILEELQLRDQRSSLIDLYLGLIPSVPISRCPFTGHEVRWPLDVFGLDGPFWDAQAPIRRLPRELPATLLSVTGALVFAEPPEWTEHLVKPGPGVPYVVPRILEDDNVQAVLTTTVVGPHLAFATVYFSADGKGPRCNDWGTDRFHVSGHDEALGWDSVDGDEEIDTDLHPWFEAERLQWIEPGDVDRALQQGADDCPYLNLEGTREWQRVQRGEVWLPSEIS